MVVYEKSEKLRAEFFKNLGLVFASPFSVIVLRLLVDKSYVIKNFHLNGLYIPILLLVLASYFLDKSRDILENLDKRRLEIDVRES